MVDLRYLIEHDLFVVCRALRADEFVSYCKKRGMQTSKEHLELLEKVGLLYPLARVQYPKIKVKIEYVNNGLEYKRLGILNDGEDWSGAIQDEYSHFFFEKRDALPWLEVGYLWAPESRPFQDWKGFIDEEGYRHTESFYSEFQCHSLFTLAAHTQGRFFLEDIVSCNESEIQGWMDRIRKSAAEGIESLKKHRKEEESCIFLYQSLANRYYPQTQSDKRTIRVPYHNFNWNWWSDYCREWDAQKILGDIDLSTDELKQLHESISLRAKDVDPLSAWYPLISFIAVDEKEKLTGKALLAQSFYAMGEMLRLFHHELTGEWLPAPDEGWGWDKNEFYGEGVIEDNLQFLEFVTNRFHLNPRPKLILVVEGDGEEEQFPRLAAEFFGASFSRLGIEVYNVEGVGNAVGEKKRDKYGALEKFIDYHHHHQTIVFVILDKEGGVDAIKKKLTKARSKFYPKRKITKEEYFQLWNESVEFDNFSCEEIAQAMTQLCEQQDTFTREEVESCYKEKKSGKRDPLKRLFEGKVSGPFSKVKLLKILFDSILSSPQKEVNENGEPKRDIVRMMKKVIDLAAKNYQPIRRKIWETNQSSGYLGDTSK
jgi:hypothetical protein